MSQCKQNICESEEKTVQMRNRHGRLQIDF